MINPIEHTTHAEFTSCTLPQAEPCVIVIYGATGDLTRRKLIPALFHLACVGTMSSQFQVIGIGRKKLDNDAFREQLKEDVKQSPESGIFKESDWQAFAPRLSYFRGDYTEKRTHRRLAKHLDRLTNRSSGNRLFYLATAPSAVPIIIQHLGAAGLQREDRGWSRIVIEKPFGSDLGSARELNHCVTEVFDESQVYRIDHYLGKETVQNILFFRFGNTLFEPLWNRNHIEYVEITAAEPIGVGARAGYYEEAGALRDMVANHLMQLLALTAMEAPVAFEADAVRDKKIEVWRTIRPMTPEEVSLCTVRAQYQAGEVENREIPGYREEPNVAHDSRTETFAALELHVDNWRWAGVPFYLRTGKRLACQLTEITVHFRSPPLALFTHEQALHPNSIILRIQPDEGISLAFGAKLPGAERKAVPVTMDFCYRSAFGENPPSAYAVLLIDAMRGDPTLFTRSDGVEAQWRLITPIEEAWADKSSSELFFYTAGSDGPDEAERMLARNGHQWTPMEPHHQQPGNVS